MRCIEALNAALHDAMHDDPQLVFMGEDVLDPYGGAFKASKGLSTAFPDRVWTMPISEAAIVGVAAGMAVEGTPVVAEIMFGDFMLLAADQLINHAAKFAWMYNDQVDVPIVVRAPMGGGRGYGPTHSQSLEKHFCGVPGLTVVATHPYADPGGLLRRAIAARQPTLLIENKVMYAALVRPSAELADPPDADVVIVSYGGGVDLAQRAAGRLAADDEILARVVAIEQLWPFPSEMLVRRVAGCDRVLVVEEGAPGWGFASECARSLVGTVRHFDSLSGPSHPIPAVRDWENEVLPGEARIVAACVDLYARP